MNQLPQHALLARLARRLKEEGSWTGETHVQKAAYLLREVGKVPFDFDFILYKHGPFSFELREELGMMRADHFLDRTIQEPPYGPRLEVTDRGRDLESRFARTMERYGPSTDWVAEKLGDRRVAELERLATALWVTRELPNAPAEERAARVQEIKRHVATQAAVDAVEEVDSLLAEAPVVAA